MINFFFLVSRQGKVRLAKWYDEFKTKGKERERIQREVTSLVLNRPQRMCNFVEWRDKKIVYKRYASLYFIACIDSEDNELLTLEVIHHFVEVLDRYFENVCELDIIFNFHLAYQVLDEMIVNGELCESNKREILRNATLQDELAIDDREAKQRSFKKR